MEGTRERDQLVQPRKQSGTSHPSSSKLRSKSRNVCLPQTWLYETSSLVFAMLSLIVLVVLLQCYDNKPGPQWYAGITLNTMVSIVSTSFRAAVVMPVAVCISQLSWLNLCRPSKRLVEHCVYDEASRGPIGSLRLLFRTRLSHIACIGAAITIVTLGLDPFFQQMISYDPESVVADIGAIASTAHEYNGTIDFDPQLPMERAYDKLPYHMKAAMYNGLLSSHLVQLPDPPFECTSGNCTWDPFLTLGVETLCINHTDLVFLDCQEDKISCYDGKFASCKINACVLNSTDDGFFQYILNAATNTTQMVIRASKSSDMKLDPIRSRIFARLTGLLGTVSWVKITQAFVSQTLDLSRKPIRTLLPESTFEAFTCGVYLTVMQVQPNVTAGKYHEKIVNSFPQNDNSLQAPTETWNRTGFYFHDPEQWNDLVYNANIKSFKDMPQIRVTGPAFQALASQLIQPEFLQGDVGTGNSDSAPRGSTDMATMLFRARNMTKAIETMAKFMTIALRSNDSLSLQDDSHNASIVASSHAVLGQMQVDELYIRVKWAWLALPIIMLGFSVFFVATTILRTWDGPVGLWKESPLALLFHAVVGDSFCELQDELRSYRNGVLDTVEYIETAATELEARVIKNFDGPPLLEISLREGAVIREKLKEEVTSCHPDTALDFFHGLSIPSSDLT